MPLTASYFAAIARLLPRPRRVKSLPGVFVITRHPRIKVSLRRGAHSPQGYWLRVLKTGIELEASDQAGVRYGKATLAQLLRTSAKTLPGMEIEDWPDFAVRGVMLDISRDKVPTMKTLLQLVDRLACCKLNQLQLYTEHTFAYRGHERVWRSASPMTPGEVKRLDRYCRDRGIELVPNQNSCGHMERWLAHEPYKQLAESTGPWRSPFGDIRTVPAVLNPLDPRSLKLVTGLYNQLLPNFSSRLLNAGCDETFELGQGRSSEVCKKRGVGQVYLDFVLKLHRAIKKRGRRMMIWSDVVHQHAGLVRRLPEGIIGLVWGYEPDHPFDRQAAAMRRAKLEFYVCPGTSSWCSFSGRTQEALANIHNAALSGLRHGAKGLLVTDWGDFGHRQYLPASYGGFLSAAAMAWCVKTNSQLEAGREVGAHIYGDPKTRLGALWLAAGRMHEFVGKPLKNRSILFSWMQEPLGSLHPARGVSDTKLKFMRRRIEMLRLKARRLGVSTPEARLSRDELVATFSVLRHACMRARLANGKGTRRALIADIRRIMTSHRRLWLMRNRVGGLRESLAHYQRLLDEYQRA
jgi:hypothetical protein